MTEDILNQCSLLRGQHVRCTLNDDTAYEGMMFGVVRVGDGTVTLRQLKTGEYAKTFSAADIKSVEKWT